MEVHLVQNHHEAVDVVEVVVQLHLGKYFSSLYIYLAIKYFFCKIFCLLNNVCLLPSRTPPASPSVITTDTIEETTQDSDVEMTDTELGKEMLPKEDTTFMVGQLGNHKSDFFLVFH